MILRVLHTLCALALSLTASGANSRPNVLFIAADDLRTDLGCYGSTEVLTPHLDALAKRGTLFTRAYCQQAVCNPSRASVLTGLRPDTTKVWDLKTHFREALPDVVTLPQLFKNAGYTTIDIGKIFHNEAGPKTPPIPFVDPVSWSQPPVLSDGAHWQDWVVPGSPSGPDKKQGATQCLDLPDNAYFDGQIAEAACAELARLKQQDKPFFLAVGFWKPHLPFNAPKKYWDLYDRASLQPPAAPQMPRGAPAIAGHNFSELRSYAGIPKEGPIPPALAAELRHGYYACISYLDAQVGKVLAELDKLGLADNTIIVFWSDHGFHLGEHALWAKTSNYELDTRVPLLVVVPQTSQPGTKTDALVELVDIYPTLAELCGLPAPTLPPLAGTSLVPFLRDPTKPGKAVAVSQHPHPFYGGRPTHMGYSLRNSDFHYIEWRDIATRKVTAAELYDSKNDPAETLNRIDDPALAATATELRTQAEKLVPPHWETPAKP